MVKVFLREKKLKHGKRSLYLDFYPPIVHPETREATRREHLKLYLYEKPKTEPQKEENRQARLIAENIRSQRQLDIQAGSYGFVAAQNSKKNFVTFFTDQAEKRKGRTTYFRWLGMLKHFIEYAGPDVRFSAVNRSLCEGFKDYLIYNASLEWGTARNYFTGFRSLIKFCADTKLLPNDPLLGIRGVAKKRNERAFLTLDELKKLANTDCEYPELKRAALASALTGLRFSDLMKLTWGEIHRDRDQYLIRFKQKKTRDSETLPVSAEAIAIFGAGESDTDRVFHGLTKWHLYHYLPAWMKSAGINRHVTFHGFRHTFATLQLKLGTDIYTLSKMLGHSDLSTTQEYARVVDEKKQEAAGRISLL